MPIPTTRAELTEQVRTAFAALDAELDRAGRGVADLPCTDDWSVCQLLAVRAWWTARVVDWVEAGRRGEVPVTPARGYAWSETPRLNADIAAGAADRGLRSVRGDLQRAFARATAAIAALDDDELLRAGAFQWAGKWPVARWISINTARQYTTARALIRKALRVHR